MKMNKTDKLNQAQSAPGQVEIRLRFVSRMIKYPGKRDVRMKLPADPEQAVAAVLNTFDIPWKDNLEKSTRIFINKQLSSAFIKSGTPLKDDDIIAFIPISGGG